MKRGVAPWSAGLGLCWHPTQPEIGQLQGAPHGSNEKRRHSIICRALVFVGTRLNQKSDNFKVPFVSCNVKRCCSIIYQCLGLCWHPTQPEIGQLQGAPS